MLADKFNALRDWAKRVLLRIVAIVSLIVLTALILDPNLTSGLVRFLIVAAIYGSIGVWIYTHKEVLTGGRDIDGLIVKTSGGALAELSLESARDEILTVVRAIPFVSNAEVTVLSKYGKAVIVLNVSVKNGGDTLLVKEKTINRTLSDLVKKRLGLKLAKKPILQIRLSDSDNEMPALPTTDRSPDTALGKQQSPFGLLKNLLPGDDNKLDASPVQKDEVKPSPPTPDAEVKENDEDEGEFWEFLRSTASSSPGNDSERTIATLPDEKPPDNESSLAEDSGDEKSGQHTSSVK